jgi:hypothetical protein
MNQEHLTVTGVSLPHERSTSRRAGLSDCYKRSYYPPAGVETLRAELP